MMISFFFGGGGVYFLGGKGFEPGFCLQVPTKSIVRHISVSTLSRRCKCFVPVPCPKGCKNALGVQPQSGPYSHHLAAIPHCHHPGWKWQSVFERVQEAH